MPSSKSRAYPVGMRDYVLLSGTANEKLAIEIGKILKKDIDNPISIFSDGEIRVKLGENVRRKHVFIIQSTSTPVNDNFMQLILMIDAAKRASANEIIAVIPYFGYSRQDRKEMSRVPISAGIVSNMIERAGADQILTVDIHSEQSEGFINRPWDNVYASYSLVPILKKLHIKDLVIASPDKGGMTRATAYARLLDAQGIAIVYKERDVHVNNQSEAFAMIGDVEGKNVLIIDDMIDGGGTLVNAVNLLKSRGAKSIMAAVTHGIFSGKAMEKITNAPIDTIYVTDTIDLRDEVVSNPKIKVVSVAPLIAEAIRRIHTGESISEGLIL